MLSDPSEPPGGETGDYCEDFVDSSTIHPRTTTPTHSPTTTTAGSRCPPDYYGLYCETYCKAADSCEKGHYTCDPISGAKICHEGWTKDSECKVKSTDPVSDPECPSQGCNLGFCWRGGCCCLENILGEYCDTPLDRCASKPCLNGANCTSSPPSSEYTCNCPTNFNGRNCENDKREAPRTNQWYDFIIGFTSNVKGNSNSSTVNVIVSNPNNQTVSFNISSPYLPSQIQRTLGPKGTPAQSVSVALPGGLQMGNNVKENKGIRVYSESPIVVHGMNNKGVASDGFLGIPVRDLGNYYIIPSYQANEASESSNIGIVGTVDGTEVRILRKLPDVGYVSQNISLRLNKLETYQVNEFGSDLTGSIVSSNAQIAVFSGASFTSVPGDQCCGDHLIEQIPPVTQWGRTFAIQYTRRRILESDDEDRLLPNEIYRVIASEDDTRVLINKSPTSNVIARINKGQHTEQVIRLSEGVEERHAIFANKPCLVAQYSTGSRFLDFASPFMMIVPPIEQYINEFIFATGALDTPYNNSLNIVTLNETDRNDVLLNTNPVQAGWVPFGADLFKSAQVQLGNDTSYILQYGIKPAPPTSTSTNSPITNTNHPTINTSTKPTLTIQPSAGPPTNRPSTEPPTNRSTLDKTRENLSSTSSPTIQGVIAAHVYGHKMGQSYGYPVGMAFNIINALNITIAGPPRYIKCECRVRTEPTPELGRILYKSDDILFKDTNNTCSDCNLMLRQCPKLCSRNITNLLSKDGLGAMVLVNNTNQPYNETLGQVMCNNYNEGIPPPGILLATHTVPNRCGEESDAVFIQTKPQHRLCCIPSPVGDSQFLWDRECGNVEITF
ncbi:unnamed protein product [Owenia fusiformis]|uniref:Uncharacterized protein n=1 Tax=Owenia fusiformis TaxID=6347 RepID=A0A8J1XVF2_OWEFU|nr:unnamed protein product [Owenia fusiformis]